MEAPKKPVLPPNWIKRDPVPLRPLLAAALVVLGMVFCVLVFSPAIWVRDSVAHGNLAPVRRGPVLPPTCQDSEFFVLEEPGPVLYVSDPSSCSGVAVWEVATMDEVVDEWPAFISRYFTEPVKVTIIEDAGTNKLVIEEETVDDNRLKLKLTGRNLFITSPASIDLASIEGSGVPADDAVPFGYAVWVQEPTPNSCADGSLDCAFLSGTLDAVTGSEAIDNVLIAIVFVQTPATVATDGPLLIDPFFNAAPDAMAFTQNAAKQGNGLSPVSDIVLGGTGTSFLTNVEVGWISSFGGQKVAAYDMEAPTPAYLLNALADASGNEPFQEVANMGIPDETSDGTQFGTTVFFHLAVYQMVYELGGVSYSRIFLTLPRCTYAANELSNALLDDNNCMTKEKPTGFQALRLIGGLLVKNDTNLIEAVSTPVGSVQATAQVSEGDVFGPAGAVVDGHVAVFDGASGNTLRDSGTPYPPLITQIKVATPQVFLADVDQFLDFDLEMEDDGGWFPGVDSKHLEFNYFGRVRCDLLMAADVDPMGVPMEACIRSYVDDIKVSEYICFLTSDDNATAVMFGSLLVVEPGRDISFEVVGNADMTVTAELVCERKS